MTKPKLFPAGFWKGAGIPKTKRRARTFVECGQCGAYHRTDFQGDCREDSERYYDIPKGCRLVAVLLVLMLSPTLALAQSVTQSDRGWLVSADDATSLDGQFRMVTPVHPCNGTVHELPPWYAPANLTITSVQVWPGADADIAGAGLKIDAYVSLYASRPAGYLLMFHALDRYAEPNGPIDKDRSKHKHLLAGDSVGGGISCSPLVGTSHIQVIVVVDYDKDAL